MFSFTVDPTAKTIISKLKAAVAVQYFQVLKLKRKNENLRVQ